MYPCMKHCTVTCDFYSLGVLRLHAHCIFLATLFIHTACFLISAMETRAKRCDKLNLSDLTALGSTRVKELSKSQTSLYRLSPLLNRVEASAQTLRHGHSVGDLNKLNPSLRSKRVSSARERLCEDEKQKTSAPSSDAIKKLIADSRSFDIASTRILTGSLPSFPSVDAFLQNQSTKRQRHRYSHQRKSIKTQSMLHTVVDYSENSLYDFATQYYDSLPLQVQVQNGYRSPGNAICLSHDDVYNMYFIHRMDVVTGTIHGNAISVPLHTDVQFCLIHDPDSNLERALIGYEYESIRDIIAANPRPKLIRSLSHWEYDGVAVDDDEVLVVIGTILITGDERVWLEAFSLKSHTTLQLHPNSRAIFTTRPLLIPLHLSDIVEYVPQIFPCTAQIYAYQQASKDLEIKLIEFHNRRVESVIVCSASASDDPLLALPTRNSVTVKIVPLKSDKAKKIRERADGILANFSPSQCSYLADTESRSLFDFQSFLYRTLKWDKEDAGVYLTPRILSASVELPEYRPYRAVESMNASQVRKTSIELPMDLHHMIALAQDTVEIVETSSTSSLSESSLLSSSEPTPPTPPRPWRRCRSMQEELLVTHAQEQSSSSEEYYLTPLSSQALSIVNLYSFAKRYSTQLPITADVKDGYVDLNGIQISRGDVITVHGIAYNKAVSVKDDQDKVYVLPIDATSEFGVLQEDAFRHLFGDEAEFETIGDIIAKEKIPTILCARNQYRGGNPQCSVEANEVIVVKKVKKMTKTLKAYSVTMEIKKTLSAKCAGHFTTSPRAVKLKISNLLQHFSGFLPGKAVAFPDAYCSELPAQLEFCTVTLTSVHPANSLIFSCQTQSLKNGELHLYSISLEHYLHLQPCITQSRAPTHHLSINHSKSNPQIHVSTSPRTQGGSFEESPGEWKKEDNVKFLNTLNENQVSIYY